MKTIIIEDQKLGIDLVTNCLTDKFDLVETCQTIKAGWKYPRCFRPDRRIHLIPCLHDRFVWIRGQKHRIH
jgi:hypothetical protein